MISNESEGGRESFERRLNEIDESLTEARGESGKEDVSRGRGNELESFTGGASITHA